MIVAPLSFSMLLLKIRSQTFLPSLFPLMISSVLLRYSFLRHSPRHSPLSHEHILRGGSLSVFSKYLSILSSFVALRVQAERGCYDINSSTTKPRTFLYIDLAIYSYTLVFATQSILVRHAHARPHQRSCLRDVAVLSSYGAVASAPSFSHQVRRHVIAVSLAETHCSAPCLFCFLRHQNSSLSSSVVSSCRLLVTERPPHHLSPVLNYRRENCLYSRSCISSP